MRLVPKYKKGQDFLFRREPYSQIEKSLPELPASAIKAWKKRTGVNSHEVQLTDHSLSFTGRQVNDSQIVFSDTSFSFANVLFNVINIGHGADGLLWNHSRIVDSQRLQNRYVKKSRN